METEIWKPVVGYEELYEVSNLWRLKSLLFWKARMLKVVKSGNWYSQVILSVKWVKKKLYCHRLVAQSFIQNPDNKNCVCHKDETLDENWMLYNWSDNLFWWTHSDNSKDMFNKWRGFCFFKWKENKWKWMTWANHFNSKKVNQYTKDLVFMKEWHSLTYASIATNIKKSNISECCYMKRKSAWWFIWRYK